MDYFNIADYWEEEGHVIDRINDCCLLWAIIPLSEQVSQYHRVYYGNVCSYIINYMYMYSYLCMYVIYMDL